MDFKKHSDFEGQHAFLSASKYHWVNYTDEKLRDVYLRSKATQRGTELHALAAECIRLGIKLPRNNNPFNRYVNDAIGYRMYPEQIVYYSEHAFGTVDAIVFKNKKLRVHDLKTGVTPASSKQLEVYAALFCLEYSKDPFKIEIEMRLYQADVFIVCPLPDRIRFIMDTIIKFDLMINKLNMESDRTAFGG